MWGQGSRSGGPGSRAGFGRLLAALAVGVAALFLLFVPASVRGKKDDPPHRPSEVIIKFKEKASRSERDIIVDDLGGTRLRTFRRIGAELHRIRNRSVEEAVALYSRNPLVEYIEPNYIVRALETPNDPRFGDLWGMLNTGQTGGRPGADIHATQAWDVFTGSPDVLIGVIDTGVDYQHPDLQANIFVNAGEIPGNGVDDDGNGFIDDVRGWDFVNDDNDPIDDFGHGTHVAGTIGAVGDNGVGVVGVNWNVRILPLKFLDAGGFGSTADAISAVEYATGMGVRLTSNSWGGGGFSQALSDAIADAGNAGILFVAAAGNAGSDNDLFPTYPASYNLDNIVAVAATDDNDQLAGFSNYGAHSVDLAAPGVNILSTVPNNGYASFSGTSMATPHVSGALGLIFGRFPAIGGAQAKQLILNFVDPLPNLAGVVLTGGRLNAFMPLAEPDSLLPGAVTDLAVTGANATWADLTWTSTGDDGAVGTASRYEVRYSTSAFDDAHFAEATLASGAPDPQAPGNPEHMRVSGLGFSTHYYFAVKAFDEFGNAGAISNLASVTTLGPPDITVAPQSLSADLFTGNTETRTVTIGNTGVGELRFELEVADQGVVGAAVAPRHRPAGSVVPDPGPPSLVPYDHGRKPERARTPDRRPRVATSGMDRSGLAASGVRILLLTSGAEVSEIQSFLSSVPGVDSVGVFDGRSSVPALSQLLDFDAVIVIVNFRMGDPVGAGNVLADYADAGGGVVLTLASFISGWAVEGRLLTEGYMPFQLGSGPTPPSSLGTFDATHPIMQGVTTATGDLLGEVELAPGAVEVARWLSGQPFVATQNDNVAAVNIFLADGGFWSGDIPRLLSNAAHFTSRAVRFLNVDPVSGVVPAGSSMDVSVRFDAAGLNGGDYVGHILVHSDDPDENPVIEANLHVTGAPDIEVPASLDFGNVFVGSALGRDVRVENAGTDLLHVTSVSVDNPVFTVNASNFNLNAGESRNIRVTLTPTAPVHETGTLTIQSDDPDEGSVHVSLQGTGLIPPDVAVDWDPSCADLLSGQTETRSLTLRNTGGSDLQYSISVVGHPASALAMQVHDPRGGRAATVQAATARRERSEISRRGDPPRFAVMANNLADWKGAPRPPESRSFGAGAQRILVYADDFSRDPGLQYVDLALQHLGLAYTAYYFDPAGFAAALIQGDWDLVIVDHNAFFEIGEHWGDLESFVLNRGKVLISTFDIDGSNSTPTSLWTTLGLTPGADLQSVPPVRWWEPAHRLFVSPQSVPEFTQLNREYFDTGDKVDPIAPARGVAGFVAAPAPGEAAIVVSNRYNAIVNSFLVVQNDSDRDADGRPDAAELMENEIDYLLKAASWLSVSVYSGVVPAGGSVDLTVTYDATGLFGGDYSADILVDTNDPDEAEGTFAACMHVTGVPDISVQGQEQSLESTRSYGSTGASTHHTLVVTEPPAGDGQLELVADGDYGDSFEHAVATAEGVNLGQVGSTGSDCTQAQGTFPIPAATLAGLVADGVVNVDVQNSPDVDVFCPLNQHRVVLRYHTSADPLDFGGLFVGLCRSRTLTVTNDGTDVLNVTAVDVDNPVFAPGVSSFTLAPRESRELAVTFCPTTPTLATGTLVIRSNDADESSIQVTLQGRGLIPPEIAVDWDSTRADLLTNTTTTRPLFLRNSGGSDLQFTVVAESGSFTPAVLAASPVFGAPAGSAPAPAAARVKTVATTPPPEPSSLHVMAGAALPPAAPAPASGGRGFGARATAAVAPAPRVEDSPLESLLQSLNQNFASVTAAIPNRFDFSEGETGSSISDGGNDMYDGGNFLNTNLGTLPYSDNAVVTSAAFGPGGRYFTRKYPGLFVLVAEMSGVSDFTIAGDLGADGGGNVDGVTLGVSAGGRHFLGFVKRVYNAGDPSVNHLIIVEQGAQLATHEFSTNTNDDFHRVLNLTGTTRLYYVLYAGSDGYRIDDTATSTIMERFLDALDLAPNWLRVAPETGTIPPQGSQELTVTFDATGSFGGVYTGALRVLSNDPDESELRLPASLHVTGVPDIDVLGAQVNLESTQEFETSSGLTHHTIELPLPPGGGGTLELIADGDFGDFSETATAVAEGRVVGQVGATGIDCTTARGTFPITSEDLTALAADGVVHVDVQNSPAVDLFCFPNQHQIRLQYFGSAQLLDFGPVFVGQSRELAVMVVNTGSQALIVGAAANLAAFEVSPGQFTLAPEGKQLVHVTFRPTSGGAAAGTLTLASNDPDEPTVTLALRAEGLVPPVIVVEPTALSMQLYTGETGTRTITLSNHGGSDLNWDLDNRIGGPMVTVHPYLELKKRAADPRTGAPVTQRLGGPDGFGYHWIDSDEPGGPTFTWEDISSIGTPIFPFPVDDLNLGPFPIGFTFSFYDNTFTSFRVCSNGFLSFTSGSADFVNQPLPNAGAPENLLAAFWSDLWINPAEGNVYYYNDGTRLIVQYHNVRHLSGAGPYSFQIQLFPSGVILYQYLRTTANPFATIGMQNAQRNDGLTMAFNTPYLHDQLAIRIAAVPPWLRATPAAGTVPAGGSAIVNVEFDARSLSGGNYDSGIRITSNDPVHPRVDVSAHLQVTDAPNIVVEPASLDFGNAFIGYPRSQPIKVTNTGTALLAVSNITSGSPLFGATPTTFDLAPAANRVVNVVFTPAAPGAVNTQLHIHSNDPNQSDAAVALSGTGLVPPEIHASPTALEAAVLPGGQKTKVLHVCNQGGSPLAFSASVSGSAGAASVPTYPPLELGRGQVDPRPGILGTGGPDHFGYRWTDSGQPEGPPFAWVDIRNTGTPVFNSSGYPSVGPFPIGFPFHFYGNTFNQFWVSYLGLLSFTSADAFFVNQPLPSAGAPENLLAVFWDDLILDTALGGQVYYQNDGSKLIVQYENLYRFDALGPPFFSFEILLYPSGEIIYQYRTLGAVTTSATIGTQNDFRNDGLLVAFNHAYVHENLAIRISRTPPWIAVAPQSGGVQVGQCVDLQVHLDASELDDRDHTATITLASNDPRTPVLAVPVTLHVGSVAPTVTEIEPNTLNLDSNGKWVTARVELAQGYDPARVLIESVILNDGVPADVRSYSGPGDFNNNGIPDLTFKFDRSAFEAILPEGQSVPVSVIGEIEDTAYFIGRDVIRVVRPKMVAPNGGEGILAGSPFTVRWTNPTGWTIDHADLFYTVDAGRNWLEMARGVRGTTWAWTVPATPCDSAEVRVFVYDTQELLGFDTSDVPFRILGSTTAVLAQEIPKAYALHPNVPNPFNPSTQIGFDLPEETRVRLRIYDARGRLVRQLLDAHLPAGRHDAHWSGENDAGAHLSSGVYFCEIVAGPYSATRRLILTK